MSKSYTLADGTTATVTATEQGVPFNEGMNVLTKAIKAKIEASSNNSSGGASSAKLVPTLSASEPDDSYYCDITYNGDGELTAYYCQKNATLAEIPITNQRIYMGDGAGGTYNSGTMNGIIVASEGEEYSPAWSMFTITGSGPI